MENKIVTLTSEKFGTVRKITEGKNVLFCASDVARALGYSNAHDAATRHCRASVKRATPISGKIQDINYIPESDVYRLICHSKLPSAMEFERWVFEEAVPKEVRKNISPSSEPEQLTIETSEYHYFSKYYNGTPVITIADFAHFAGVSRDAIGRFLAKGCINGADYFLLVSESLVQFKKQNPSIKANAPYIYAITKSGAEKLIKHFKCYDKPQKFFIEEKKNVPENLGIQSRTDFSTEEYIITLEVLNALRLKQKGRIETSFSPEHAKSSIKALCIAMELVATPLAVHVKE